MRIYTYIHRDALDYIYYKVKSADMSEIFRSRSHVEASMVLSIVDHLFIHNYIRSLLYIFKPILMVRMRLGHVSYCSCV